MPEGLHEACDLCKGSACSIHCTTRGLPESDHHQKGLHFWVLTSNLLLGWLYTVTVAKSYELMIKHNAQNWPSYHWLVASRGQNLLGTPR